MKDLRALLIDCRIELRKLARDFQKSELCERLDLAIQQASNATLPPPPGETAIEATHAPPSEKAQTVSQVALAWQTAARDLKFSDPAIHARLGEKVMRLLGAKTLADPANEILQLEGMVKAAEARIAELEKAIKSQEVERDALLGALAQAAPKLKDGGDRLAVGLARVAWLKTEAGKADNGAAPARRAPEPQDTVPTPDLLQAAAAGAATLSKEQREWCVGEAMVVTGFQFTPVELIEKGDAAMARLILEARKGG
ncbi:hypothetical protein [Arenimonas donghaensis]|uniref:Uncharacterized protein n=1 Tax=Arenimonas donghaensis DSM 18148 = HO3-R19 TaxID=1121014 RepID=A0A087MGM6_9GAMM|nr:hypothetical protein [Arenimonas donghaensis]KFL36029.1 hypothetical protein N788_05650 [Arenimonas donghaensis DSM 18148 = HO3-R19]